MTYKNLNDCLNCQKEECDNCKSRSRMRKEYFRQYFQNMSEEKKQIRRDRAREYERKKRERKAALR